MIQSLIAEDHSHAYGLWKEMGVTDAVCIHVDAHLDVMDRGFSQEVLEKVAACKSREGLEKVCPPTFLPWGGLHCGNYLYPALKENIVTHLIWVVPEGLVGESPLLDFARDELLNWVELTIPEYQSLKTVGKCVEGTLGGHRFSLCTASNLPEFDTTKTVLLDIDVDYYQDSSDLIWQTPSQLKRQMGLNAFDLLTIAVSVDGGYTCLEHRYLAEITESVFLTQQDRWEKRVEAILVADAKRQDQPEVYDPLLEEEAPPWLRAALLLKKGLAAGENVLEAAQGAQKVDPRYSPSPFNEALVHARGKRIDKALELLNQDDDQQFMRAVLSLQGGHPAKSKAEWARFLEKVELTPSEKAHALFLLGQASLQLNETAEAVDQLTQANLAEPNNFQYLLFLGLSQQLSGDLKKAAKTWRKALGKHPDLIACIELHLELSRLYRDMGRAALAEAELKRVQQKDGTGQFKLLLQMEHIRSSQSSTEPRDSHLWRPGINIVGVH